MKATRQTPRQPLRPPAGGVAIRMYRQGLGDCFLLAFAGRNERPVYVLIDCGVHRAQPDGTPNLHAIVADIAVATGGNLDVLVVTHPQEEHLAGLVLAEQEFVKKRLKVNELWLAWSEDADQPQGQALQAARLEAWQALDTARRHLLATAAARDLEGSELALYQRLDDACSAAAHSAVLPGTPTILNLLREQKYRTKFLRPSDVSLRIPGAAAARAYVLGPPDDKAPAGAARTETFLTQSSGLTSFATAARSHCPPAAGAALNDAERLDLATREELCHPFSKACRIDFERAARHPFFQQHFGLNGSSGSSAWHDLQNEWLGAAERVALDLGRHAGNSSLALAFEIGPRRKGRVLLFPGDAQVGNWLSWEGLRWGRPPKTLSIADLFARTVVYKVADHGSAAATLKHDAKQRPYGWALMPANLVAMLPVDERVASALPGWNMPDPHLCDALHAKAGQTLLRSDDTDERAATPPSEWEPIPGVARSRWRRSTALKADREHPLFYDIRLKP
jgi:hypothetical protein